LTDLRAKEGVDQVLKASRKVSEIIPKNLLNREGDICDKKIDLTFKDLLCYLEFGLFMQEIVGHYEYFMNTLA
jgi:hypothetical protein